MSEAKVPEAANDVGIGHNTQFAFRNEADLAEYLDQQYADILARAKELLEKGDEFLIIDDAQQDADATEFLVKLRACYKWAETSRVSEKQPYDDRAGQVHAFFKTNVLDVLGLPPPDKRPFDPLTRTDLGLGPRIAMAQTIYKLVVAEKEKKAREAEAARARAEEDRRRAEAAAAEEAARELERAAARKRNEDARAAAEAAASEARRKADEAAAAENKAAEERAAAESAAAAPMADLSRSRGGRGGVSSLRTFMDFRDVDRDTIDLEALRHYFKDTAIDQAVRAYMDGNKATVEREIKNGKQPIKGVIIYEAHKSASRA